MSWTSIRGDPEVRPMDEMAADQVGLKPVDVVLGETRYGICHSGNARVVVQRRTGAEREEIVAELLDISRVGARLTVDVCIPFEEAVRLKIDVPELKLQLVVAAQVRWTWPVGERGWTLGCAFKPKLTEDALDQLATAGYANRRHHARFPLVLRATACWELGETNIPVVLYDASEGGFAMISPQLGGTGRNLLLHLCLADGTPASIGATIRWHRKTADGYLIGCSFINEKDFELLLNAARVEESEEEAELPPRLAQRDDKTSG